MSWAKIKRGRSDDIWQYDRRRKVGRRLGGSEVEVDEAEERGRGVGKVNLGLQSSSALIDNIKHTVLPPYDIHR